MPAIAPIELPPAPARDPYSDALARAVVLEMGECGYDAVTIEDVINRAGSSRAEFDARFTDLDDCVVQSYEAFIVYFKRRTGGAFNRHDQWRDALRAAAYETADWIAEDPLLARFGMTEVQQVEMGRVRREEVFVFCAQMIEAGRTAAPDPDAVPAAAAAVATGSIIQLLTHRMQEGEVTDPHSVIPELMFAVVRAYLGEEAAREELDLGRPSSS